MEGVFRVDVRGDNSASRTKISLRGFLAGKTLRTYHQDKKGQSRRRRTDCLREGET